MTMSISVDVSDSLDEARTRLLRTARALNRAWAAALCAVVGLVVAAMVLLVVAMTMRPVYVVIWSVLLAATSFNVSRFWPRRPVRHGVVLDEAEVALLRAVVDPQGVVTWPDAVRLVAGADLEISHGELLLGLPFLACLDQGLLRELLVVATAQARVEEERGVRWAVRVAHGDVGRSLVARRGPRLTWPSARFSTSLRARAAALEADLENWAGACARAAVWTSDAGAAAQASRDQVSEAWVVLTAEWLDPAFARGRRHVAPFTGLRQFVEAADASGWLDHPGPWWPTIGVLADLLSRHEEEVARDLDGGRDHLRPIGWEDHPVEVTVPQWRALVTEVLDAARRTRHEPAVTLASVLSLLEDGEGPALAEATAVDRGLRPGTDPAYGAWSEKFVARVLTASIGIAAIDTRTFHPIWVWPEGSRLAAEDGWTLPLASIVAEVLSMVREGGGLQRAYAELREALVELAIDIDEPLWLDHESGPRPERPIGSFAARQKMSPRLAVVTDRSLHLFRDPQAARLPGLAGARDPRGAAVELRKRMLAVWQGDTTEQVLTLATDDVRRARFGQAVGGLWWRLTLTGDGTRLVLRGRGVGTAEAAEIREWLGDRLVVHRHHGIRAPVPPRVD